MLQVWLPEGRGAVCANPTMCSHPDFVLTKANPPQRYIKVHKGTLYVVQQLVAYAAHSHWHRCGSASAILCAATAAFKQPVPRAAAAVTVQCCRPQVVARHSCCSVAYWWYVAGLCERHCIYQPPQLCGRAGGQGAVKSDTCTDTWVLPVLLTFFGKATPGTILVSGRPNGKGLRFIQFLSTISLT